MKIKKPMRHHSTLEETSDAIKRYYRIRHQIAQEVAPFALTIDDTPTPANALTSRNLPIIRKERA